MTPKDSKYYCQILIDTDLVDDVGEDLLEEYINTLKLSYVISTSSPEDYSQFKSLYNEDGDEDDDDDDEELAVDVDDDEDENEDEDGSE